ncbi:MAG TPA: type IV secretion system protein [Alphaproteobacteria bacterium]|jgi:intracellular multiplication protein IcmP
MADDKNTLHDSAVGWAILGMVFFCLLALFWYFKEYEVKSAFRWMRYAEMKAVSPLLGDDYTVHWNGYDINFNEWYEVVPDIPSSKLDGMTLGVVSMLAMQPLRLFFVGALGLMGLWSLMYGPSTQFRRKMGLDGLIGTQAKVFPIISPFVKFNPTNQPPRPPGAPVPAELPAFAEALAPEEWVAYNQIPVPDGQLDEHAAYVSFSHQLGPRWQGPLKMKPYKQILLACFCLKAVRKRKDADSMMGRLARCWSFEHGLQLGKDKTLLKEAQKVLRDKNISGKTLSKCNQHAFETTVLLRALATAREEGGVMAPAQFVWLRAFDRVLWYPLNNLGRQSFHMEGMGAMAHYKAERMTRRPVPRPKVQDAVNSLATYMKSRRARPIPQLDYSKSKKRGIKQPKKK